MRVFFADPFWYVPVLLIAGFLALSYHLGKFIFYQVLRYRGVRAWKQKDFPRAGHYFARLVNAGVWPVSHWRFYLGWSYMLQAGGKPKTEAAALFYQATELFAEVDRKIPDSPLTLQNWGLTLLELALISPGTEQSLLNEAGDKFARFLALQPEEGMIHYCWGYALYKQAKRAEGERQRELLQQAQSKLEQAEKLLPEHYDTLNQLGVIYKNMVEYLPSSEQGELYALALAKHRKATELEPKKYLSWGNWGLALMGQAVISTEVKREMLFAEAQEKLLQAEALQPGSSAYNLACLAARRGQLESCQAWLEAAARADTLQDRNYAWADPDLASVREYDWFINLPWPVEPRLEEAPA